MIRASDTELCDEPNPCTTSSTNFAGTPACPTCIPDVDTLTFDLQPVLDRGAVARRALGIQDPNTLGPGAFVIQRRLSPTLRE